MQTHKSNFLNIAANAGHYMCAKAKCMIIDSEYYFTDTFMSVIDTTVIDTMETRERLIDEYPFVVNYPEDRSNAPNLNINKSVNEHTIKIYPNPALNTIHISFNDKSRGSKGVQYFICNYMGEAIAKGYLEDSETDISLPGSLSSGLYNIVIIAGNQTIYRNSFIKL
jgi:hypothetical protein